MEWFKGDVAAAITLSKQKNAVFVVFIYGADESSKSALEAINSSEVSHMLSSNDFVAIKLESGSEPYHQFAQIYQVVPVPSLFFIGQNGIPLDIMAGDINSSGLLEHIAKVKSSTSGTTSQGNLTSNVASTPSSTVNSETENTVGRELSTPAASSNQEQGVTESLEERMRRAEKARVALAAKKQKEEEQKEREREIARRREGQELAKAQKSRESLEAEQALEERRRDRELEREAKERVLQQIARDKAERAAKFGGEKKSTSTPEVSTTPNISAFPVPASAARLQFRLPDGSSHTNIFKPEALLGEVRQYVKTTLHPGSFTLSMAFPRAELASTDDSRSLQDMGLVPSAALLILPGPSTARVVASSGAGVMGLLWLLLSPFSFIWTFVSSRIWGTPNDNRSPPSQPERGTSAAAAAAQARANQSDVRHRVRREGNIHRLAGMQDPDDENNTYNGNSTQQM